MAKPSGTNKKTVMEIAKDLQQKAETDAEGRGFNELKGNPEKGQYKHNGDKNDDALKDICTIDKKHSNDKRNINGSGTDKYDGPCTGKGGQLKDRLNIGKEWGTNKEANPQHKEVYFPPRRLDMCTSNIENLDVDKAPGLKDNNVNHSFLGDVLLSAKFEGQDIVNKIGGKGDDPRICRAMKSSFADIGDIIRGIDVWSKNGDMVQLENNLQKIFGKIKDKVGGSSYASGEKETPKYKTLRSDWWVANRDQVWQAMVCDAKDDSTLVIGNSDNTTTFELSCGKYNPKFVPYDDYIPQKLRWLNEWNESYCKQLQSHINSFKDKCSKCKSGVNLTTCIRTEQSCKECKSTCEKYKTFVEKWNEKWKDQKEQYNTLYQNATSTTTGNDEIQNKLNEFIEKLKSEGKSDYKNSPEEFINSLLGYRFCTDANQKEIKDDKDDAYVFSETPKEYKKACTCDEVPPPPPSPPPEPPKPGVPPPAPPCTNNKIIDAANTLQHQVQTELVNNGVNLKGEAHKGTYKYTTDASTFNTNLCGITIQHTNDVRPKNQRSGGPCTGKGTGTDKDTHNQRFIIGQAWTPDNNQVKDGHNDVLLPPRRKHMCTSNLENLGSQSSPDPLKNVTDTTKFNHSFLGEVLVTAKYEGQDIVHKHLSKGDTPGICNAMKYSFADLGDIIRGTDIWEKNDDMVRLQGHLKHIFGKIRDQNGGGNSGKYSGTDGITKLRSHWWEANRKEIWKAMTCTSPDEAKLFTHNLKGEYSFSSPKCGHNDPRFIPSDDYIPQKLRWLTEWVESYCKQLRSNYWPVVAFCWNCKKQLEKKPNGSEKDKEKKLCERCTKMCDVYKQHVTDWQNQWKEQKEKYNQLYQASGGTLGGKDEIDNKHNEFLKKLKDNGKCNPKDSNDYSKPEEFVDLMGGYKYCKDTSQNEYKEDKSSDDSHAFKENPKGYKDACAWKDDKPGTTPTPPQSPPTNNDVCKIVKECIQENEQQIKKPPHYKGDCNPKITSTNKQYPKWDCEKNKGLIADNDQGACMPPRRQKLCIHYLENFSGTTSDDLRQAFIKCAALETYYSWMYYKDQGAGKNTEAEKLLEKGEIPYDFMRNMLFTYGDFKDLCLNKDISKKDGNNSELQNKIDKVFPTNGKSDDGLSREQWWDKYGPSIWKGMLCGLSHHIHKDNEQKRKTLTENDKYKYERDDLTSEMSKYIFNIEQTPQFFRWFTEWSDEFCTKQKDKLATLRNKCKTCIVKTNKACKDKSQCNDCQKECENYKKNFIELWKKDYTSQKNKFDKDKKDKYDTVPLVEKTIPAYTYLHKSLVSLGLNDNCMEKKSTTQKGDIPQSMDTPPNEFKYQCECDDKPPKPETCDQIMESGTNQWDCSGNIVSGGSNTDKMCVKNEKEDDEDATSGGGSGRGKQGGKARPTSDDFYDLFNEWLHDMEHSLDIITNLIEESCKKIDKKKSGDKECTKCKDLCDCYDQLKSKIDVQWSKQKNYFEQYKVAKKAEMEFADLDMFLEAQCVLNEIGKSKDIASANNVEDIVNEKKCKKKDGSKNETIFDEKLDNTTKKKETECEVCQHKDTVKDNECAKIEDATGCNTKDYDDPKDPPNTNEPKKNWKCNKESNETLDKDACVPPRTQQLCIANLHDGDNKPNFNDENNMKSKLKEAIKKETKLLWTKYKDDKDKECKSVNRSINDFKNLVLGTSLWKNTAIENIEKKIGEIIAQKNGPTGGKKMTQQEWWDANKSDFWKAVQCGIREGQTGVTGNECPPIQYDTEYDSQFYWWFMEWGDDFCAKKKEKAKAVAEKCGKVEDKNNDKRNCDSGGQNIADQGCKSACDDYKNLIDKHRTVWTKFSEKFNEKEESKKKKNKSSYNNYTDYLITNCTDCSGTDFEKVFKDSNVHGDFETTCTCVKPSSAGRTGGASTPTTKDIEPCDATIIASSCKTKDMSNTKWDTSIVSSENINKVYSPPRRQKLCLGNLMLLTGGEKSEYMNNLEKQLYAAAKKEAELLRDLHNKDNTKICPAIKRSFYDFGDIIKGTDLERGDYDKKVEEQISKIFEDSGKTSGNPREEWWDTHKDKVWKAMTNCDTTNNCGATTPTDYDKHDQFLRWFIEWGEDFCTQKQQYMTQLQSICLHPDCNTECEGTTCPACQKLCAIYHNWLLTKKNEWNGQKDKYRDDYKKNKNTHNIYDGTKEGPHEYLKKKTNGCDQAEFNKVFKKGDNEYGKYKAKCKKCIEKLTKETIKKIKERNNPGSTAQPDGKGVKPMPNPNPSHPGSTATKGACEIVETTLKNKDGRGRIAACGEKDFNTKSWDCKDKIDSKYREGPCMSPRRQSLCINNLKALKGDKTTDDLRKALIQCASIETYWLWEQYKKDYPSEVSQLNNGTIPEGFKRIMSYTLGDFRDLILDTDISAKKDTSNEENDVGAARKSIDNILKPNGKNANGETPESWWKNIEEQVWEAMVCSLSYNTKDNKIDDTTRQKLTDKAENKYSNVKFSDNTTTLSSFVARPQFLRWMTEWGEHYCVTQKKHYDEVASECVKCDATPASTSGRKATCNDEKKCEECKNKCNAYKNLVNTWEKQWKLQEKKYLELYNKATKPGATASPAQEDPVVTYLKPHTGDTTYSSAGGYLTKEGFISGCENTQNDFANSGGSNNYAFKEYPNTYDKQCTCVDKPAPVKPVVNPTQDTASQNPGKKGKDKGSQKPSPSSPGSNCTGPDKGDGGTCQGGPVINTGEKGQGGITVITNQSSGKSSDPKGATTDPKSANDPPGNPASPNGGSASGPGSPLDPGGTAASGNQGSGGSTGQASGEPDTPSSSSSSSSSAASGTSQSGSDPNKVPSVPGAVVPQPGAGVKPGASVDNGSPSPGTSGPADPFDQLETCPLNNTDACNKIGNAGCPPKKLNYDLDKWETQYLTHSNFKNKTVLVPPRRAKICFNYIIKRWHTLRKEELFTKRLLDTAATEAQLLSMKYKEPKEREILFDSMKYSFADIGNIIKGDDILEDLRTRYVKQIFEKICKKEGQCNNGNTNDQEIKKKRESWWKNNKTKLWHAMLCGYKRIATNGTLDNKWCTVPTEDKTPQFLRWFQEWTEIFCTRKKELENEVTSKCDNFNCDSGTGNVDDTCRTVCERYKNFILSKQIMYKLLEKQYNDNYIKINAGGREAPDYLKIKCKDGKCDCITKNFNNDTKWETPYDTFYDTKFKSICECPKPQSKNPSSNSPGKSGGSVFSDFWKDIAGALGSLSGKAVGLGVTATGKAIEHAANIIPDAADLGLKAGIGALDKIKTMLDATNPKSTNPGPDAPEPKAPGGGTPPSSGIKPEIVTSTVPVGIGFALGSIALLFYYMKKKTTTTPPEIFRVLNIPQNDDAMPTKTSTNRYIPYRSQYKGKTYIYVEGDEPDDYVRDISSSDVTTSSSESEYEEMDINDIYKSRSPKYKTLIEVVLKPSKSTQDDTPMYHENDNNKLTDNEWNELKEDFISNMLQNHLPNENIIDDNIYKNIQPDTLHNNMEEKPFITQIQDRFLHGDNEVTYNINWNIPENINRTTNIVNDPKYVSQNLYSGIDLINDSLNRDNDIDIYDELLKRKENELYGTKHPKNTTFNRVATQTYTDPIMNQIDLFHKWLERHRYMCEKWNNKEEMLSKLYDEWNKSNNEHVLYIPSNGNADDINTINDENYNMINANKHEPNHKTSLEHLGSTNIPPNDLTGNNNDSQTKNFRTNVSINIHFDEKNNIPRENDDLENFYNSFDDDENNYMNLKRIVSR
ncbi:erythrocyte membrane protein 1, PfEMP1, putative [Plasmodium sp. gorilla clade G2]|uniref:erythrocyte membrane protein 1, PfEMP1, putative n=1 Tax=Plasmodium sp. gorilla clade G2 TaxID=880535 RepID=UPI000D2007DD|nr:erythrocyte membrane protein 1, PfEMP1, putative [Plasmodium sp. gorilla clade G2]SOV12999.1 erythrocyte membrane protein 1, PfEMP1, putative [Plasmodium sp. gorilla clade G2]